jgi:SAM-dependent methyltransferase
MNLHAEHPARWKRALRKLYARFFPQAPAEVFAAIYRENRWRSEESRSGPGSTLAATAPLRAALSAWVRANAVRSVLDIPCGDFHWMQHVDLSGADYTGADIVPALIEQNTRRYAAPGRRFVVLDLTRDPLPRADLVIVRDALVHLPLADVHRALDNLRASGSRYAALTQIDGIDRNREITTGAWRPLDLCAAPFHWPAPLERLPEYNHPDNPPGIVKSLAVWRLNG